MLSSFMSRWDLSNVSDKASGSRSPMSIYFPLSMFLRSCGGIGGRLGFSNVFASLGVRVLTVVIAGPTLGGSCAAACEAVAPCPVFVVVSNQYATEGGCPDSVPADTPCPPVPLHKRWGGGGQGGRGSMISSQMRLAQLTQHKGIDIGAGLPLQEGDTISCCTMPAQLAQLDKRARVRPTRAR